MTIRLEENIYNRRQKPHQPKFKIWKSAGLMLSYRCPARCACCYVRSSPQAGSSSTEMSVELAIACWRSVRALAGERGKVHITGGEPFGDYERLKKILQEACEEQLGGLEKIETNAYWCSDDSLVRSRLTELRELGVHKIQISTDVYHQEYIPLERVKRAVRIGREIMGQSGIQVRWRDYLSNPVLVGKMAGDERAEAFRRALEERPERMVGRAAEELAILYPARSYKEFQGMDCRRSFLGAQHVHIDGAGNVFSGTCVGIIVGQVDDTAEGLLERLWKNIDYRDHPIIGTLIREGPYGLLEMALDRGYHPKRGYADKCHFCYDMRAFLCQFREFRRMLGPEQCYGKDESIPGSEVGS